MGCVIVISNAIAFAKKMSAYIRCSDVARSGPSGGNGSEGRVVVRPLIASMLGPYISVARTMSLGVTVVFCCAGVECLDQLGIGGGWPFASAADVLLALEPPLSCCTLIRYRPPLSPGIAV